jgi:undecaprenyl diphosphate synthase
MDVDSIDENALEARLYTSDIPDPDLIVRTGGEQRISNFLLWQSAYAEFVFADVLWPDFSREKLEDSIEEFSRRERRYGASTA